MTEQNNDEQQVDTISSQDSCPICGELALDYNEHICLKKILEEIDEENENEILEDEESVEYEDKTYGEKLDDAEFIDNYYEEYGVDDEDDDIF
jgi:hypothetical protein